MRRSTSPRWNGASITPRRNSRRSRRSKGSRHLDAAQFAVDAMPDRNIDLQLTGMTCAACAARIEKVLNRTEGVRADVNFATEIAHVAFDADKVTPEALIAAVRKAGYDAAPAPDPFAQPEEEARKETAHYRRELAVFAVAALFTAPFLAQMAFMTMGTHAVEMP